MNKLSNDGSTKGNIELVNPGDFVLGVIFSIDSNQIDILDRFEGAGFGYNKTTVLVRNESNEELSCLTYIADPSALNNAILPYDWYINFFIAGATQNNFPPEYINFLKQFDFTIDSNEERQDQARRIMSM